MATDSATLKAMNKAALMTVNTNRRTIQKNEPMWACAECGQPTPNEICESCKPTMYKVVVKNSGTQAGNRQVSGMVVQVEGDPNRKPEDQLETVCREMKETYRNAYGGETSIEIFDGRRSVAVLDPLVDKWTFSGKVKDPDLEREPSDEEMSYMQTKNILDSMGVLAFERGRTKKSSLFKPWFENPALEQLNVATMPSKTDTRRPPPEAFLAAGKIRFSDVFSYPPGGVVVSSEPPPEKRGVRLIERKKGRRINLNER